MEWIVIIFNRYTINHIALRINNYHVRINTRDLEYLLYIYILVRCASYVLCYV